MPLSGTIQDFGVADIFQLISQQAKTGRLSLSNGVETVLVLFRDGTVVHAENASAPSDRLFGNLLVRAEALRREDLDRALQESQRTLKRLGRVLVELGFLDEGTVVEFARLQMTETIYALFAWNRGTYEFESMEVEASPDGVNPIRAEHIVMNGIRMTDEWPSIREKIPSYTWTVEPVRSLPVADTPISEDPSLGTSFSDFLGGGSGESIGESEYLVAALIAPDRSVQKLIDLSRIGEFETSRALTELMSSGYIRIVKPRPAYEAETSWSQRVRNVALDAGRVALSAGLVLLAGALVARGLAERRAPQELQLEARAVHRRVEAIQLRILERALEVYRLRHGQYPEALGALVGDGLVDLEDLRHPYDEPYDYVANESSFRLLAPLR